MAKAVRIVKISNDFANFITIYVANRYSISIQIARLKFRFSNCKYLFSVRSGALVHYKAEVGVNSIIDSNVTINIGTIIGSKVKIEKDAFIGPFTQIEDEVVIGSKVYIDPNVLILARQRVQAGIYIISNKDGSLSAKKYSDIGNRYFRQQISYLRGCLIKLYFSNPKSTIADNVFYPAFIMNFLPKFD